MKIASIIGQLRGGSVKAKAMRGTGLTILNVGGTNALRLLSNLLLTRLLFPEAFGLMALTQVFIYGLQTFSDIGIHTMLIQHKRGAEREFSDTLWTLQIIRGAVLWLGACVIAFPVAAIYEQPILTSLLPFVALTLVIEGFKPTKEALANRELMLERVVFLHLVAQLAGLVVMAALAFWLRTVWALALGTLVMAALRVVVFQYWLPGRNNRLHWDREIVRETLHFGAFIFLSTIAAFLINMGDRAILGAFVDVSLFGVYSIAAMLGSVPAMISGTVARTVILPLYRMKRPTESAENRENLFRARRMVGLLSIAMSGALALISLWLVDFLYDDRYALAGPILLLFCLSFIPMNGCVGAQDALLGCGDSKRYFYLMGTMALVQNVLVFFGTVNFGVMGAILAPGVAWLVTYPLRAWLTSRYDSWDPKGELGLMAAGFAVTGLACWLFQEDLMVLAGLFELPG